MTSSFEARLLGQIEFLIDGNSLTLQGPKDRALLAYLCISPGQEHLRETLAGIFWSKSETARARDSLKHAISRVRRALEPHEKWLKTTRTKLAFLPDDMEVDISRFLELSEDEDEAALGKALEMYNGRFLADLVLDEEGFDEWLLGVRGKVTRAVEYVVSRTLAFCTERGDPAASILAARRALDIDPYNERACRLLMRSLNESGDRSLAVKAFKAFSTELEQALGIAPEAETVALLERLMAVQAGQRQPDEAPKDQPAKPLTPGKPSVAVLAFKPLGVEDYVADGMTEEVVTALSRVRGILLIAYGSSFSYRNSVQPAGNVGRDLGVRYLVEGKIMQQADQLRAIVSLRDAEAMQIIWSDSFVGLRKELFALQEDIAAQIAGVLLPKVEVAEMARSASRHSTPEDAYDIYLRGLSSMHRWTDEDSQQAIDLFNESVRMAPNFAAAYAMAVRCYSLRKASGWVRDRKRETEAARRFSRLAADLAGDDALPLTMAATGFGFVAGEPEKGIRLIERALQLNPNFSIAWFFSGWLNVWLGLHETAIEHFSTAMRLSPHDPQFGMMQGGTACAHLLMKRHEMAITWAEKAVIAQPHYWIAWCVLAAARAMTGDIDGSKASLDHVMKIEPSLNSSNFLDFFPLRRAEDINLWARSLKAAGLPD